MRNIFVAPEGKVLIAADYAGLEMATLAQHCYTTYGRSRMRDIINADVDLHSWFAARVMGLITDQNDVDVDDPASIARVKSICKTQDKGGPIPKERRSLAKSANFGFPGGMRAPKFHSTLCAAGVTNVSLEECVDLREAWLRAFPEMDKFMKGEAYNDADAEDQEHSYYYIGRVITGRTRGKATYNASLNMSFQGLAADGAKIAGWNLGKLFKIVDFIHDEFIIELDENKLDLVPHIENIMVASMRQAVPDVLIKVESAAMRRWDKGAKAEFDESGTMVAWDDEDEEDEELE